ncbi:putative peptidoglycan glycosyltransferase FtsW [Qipengyuania sp. DY56-A-20]|jgi:cell division protein FtsW|uniref:Probable peptidoglycan glycosyltransferase FtsW n=1 Tax=Qipengyuania benthica TaxID=3067651 RepID=A0ABT9H6G6_9SPHN|nr:putative peptidoglycan glycosyltransferase FtsW [Qipengyuania sp. DY56-A-20]MDP4538903.1 putative peptidoglycan glycosyltransferase FtsW [Qipengyuania sp. DY56-A-20]
MNQQRPFVPGAGRRAPRLAQQKLSRWSELKIWWREVDRVLLGLVLALMAFGAVAVAAASPATADRLSTTAVTLDPLYFFYRHLVWQMVALAVLLIVSMFDRSNARRFGLVLAALMLGALFLVPVIGSEVNGATRWLEFGIRFQPSEFLKPGFVIATAWVLAWRMRDPNLPVVALTFVALCAISLLLMMQPNLGDTLLFVGVWFVMVLLAGVPVQRMGALAGIGVVALIATYFLYDNARHRIDSFFGGGTAYDQVDLAERTLLAGGWTGSGYGLGIRKMNLPEAHTDYIFSVIGEEFGLIVCGLVAITYLAIMVRVLMKLVDEDDLFALLAGAGLVTLFGGQAFINMLVNLQLFPSKGMTLPLVSYGGSSTIAICLTVGLLLAITRRNPYLKRETRGLADLLGLAERPDPSPVDTIRREIHP